MIWVVKPALAWALTRAESRSTPKFPVFAGIITVVLACALATEQIGVHPIFGAFAAGVVMPRSSRLVAELTSKIEGITMWFMLPIFFVVVGLNTKLGALTGGMQWLACGLITAVAIATKFLGTGIAARATGSPLRDSVALGVMMNCRGLTELVVLTVGLQLGVLSPALFAMFVIMALLTTAMTGPLLRSAMPAQPVRSDERKASQHDPALL
jgi:Kef-type K+ transport system membrane component KefB